MTHRVYFQNVDILREDKISVAAFNQA